MKIIFRGCIQKKIERTFISKQLPQLLIIFDEIYAERYIVGKAKAGQYSERGREKNAFPLNVCILQV